MLTPGRADAPGAERMDRMYRYQRHIYDLTRKFYLLGRDRLLDRLPVQPGEQVVEVGCGTGRNLVRLARRHPQARLFGLDVSAEMLKTARDNLTRAGLIERVPLVQGYAEALDAERLFGLDRPFDRVLFSYSLSMIPDWAAAIEAALGALRSGGTLHIVDFGAQEGMPPWFRAALKRWLDVFDVHFRPEIPAHMVRLAAEGRGAVETASVLRGYAYLLSFTKAG